LIREAHTDVKVVIFTMYDQPKFIKEAFRQGAEGYILKSTSLADLVDGVRRVKEGHVYLSNGLSVFPGGNGKHDNAFEDGFLMRHSLTRRELEVLELIVRAKSNKEIADQLFISDQTVSVHRKNLMRKLKVSSTAALVRFFVDQDMFSK
jgi:DNA-binding NarL/FixJ family response regulator